MHFLNRKTGQHPFEVEDAPRPHAFVFTVDMIPPEFYRQPSPYVDTMRLPAWRGVQRDAVCFENAFSVSPLCGPSRAAMLTGRYPYILVNEERAHDGFEVEVRPDDAIYPEYLKTTGYLTGHVGKSHIGTEKFMQAFGEACSPWNRWAPPVYDDPEYHAFLRARNIDGFRYAREIRGLKHDRSSPGHSYGGWIEQNDGRPFPMEATYPHYLVDRAVELLESLIHRARGTAPLYLHLDLFAPHQPFMIPAGMEERERVLREGVQLPESYQAWRNRDFRSPENEARIYGLYRKWWGLYEEQTARDYIVANLLQMEVIDHALERFVSTLKEKGLYEDSVLLLAGDHGEMNVEQGLIDKGVYGHPKAARVPLMLKLPGNKHAGNAVDSPVCLLDVAPTMFELTGVRPYARLDGESLLKRLAPRESSRETPFLFEAGWHVAPNPAVAMHLYEGPDRHYRYVYNLCSPHDELYDLNDPHYRNQIDNPELDTVRKQLLEQMARVLSADARWRCYWHTFSLDKAEDLPELDEGDKTLFMPE